MQADEAKVKQLQDKLAEKLNVYEEILSKQPYLAGDVSFFCHQRTNLLNDS